jgi:hypothetical protein
MPLAQLALRQQVCAGLALVYLAVSTGGDQRSQLAERAPVVAATVAARSAQLQQVSEVAPAESAQAKLTQEIKNAAEMHAAQMIRKMEAASAAKAKAAVAPARAMSPAVQKQQAYNMPETHHGITGAQRAIEQREVAEEERENEGSTESVMPGHSRKFAPRMVQQQVISPISVQPSSPPPTPAPRYIPRLCRGGGGLGWGWCDS